MTNLTVVVDPDYGVRLEQLVVSAPVWIVSTQTNKTACENLWKSHPHRDHREKGACTLYKTIDPEDRLKNFLGIVPELETHHGEVQGNELVFPRDFVLDVIGLVLDDEVTNELRELGFTSFSEIPEGFRARR